METMNCPKCDSDNTYWDENEKGEYWKCSNCNTFFSREGKTLETHKIVCPQCDGSGHTTNPAIDGNGLSAEDFHADPDFAEDYFSGRYDVRCNECNGHNVIDEVIENWDNPLFVAMVANCEEEANYQAYTAAERAMGA